MTDHVRGLEAAVDHPQIVCGARETRTSGTWECIAPPQHADRAHYFVLLQQREEERP